MSSRDRLLIMLSMSACLGAVPSGALAADARETISVLGQSELAVKAKPGSNTASAYLTLLNSSNEPLAVAVAFEASSNAAVAVAAVSPNGVPAMKAERVKVTLSGLEKQTETVEGVLVITGGTLPVSRSVTITPAAQPTAPWPDIILIGCVAAMALLAICVVGKANRDHRLSVLAKPAPGPKWSFDSWATTATAVGAILGTVLGAATLPTVPREIDKDTLVRLNLLFAALVLVGPFVFQAIRRPGSSSADPDAGLWGYNWSLLLACSITCGAVLGELATLALLAWELIGGHTWGWVAVGLLATIAALAAYYFAITAWALATTDWQAPVKPEGTEELDEADPYSFQLVAAPVTVRSQLLRADLRQEDRPFTEVQGLTRRPRAPSSGARRSWSLP